jgi:hypothetical protein
MIVINCGWQLLPKISTMGGSFTKKIDYGWQVFPKNINHGGNVKKFNHIQLTPWFLTSTYIHFNEII